MATDTQSSIRGKATARDLASEPVVIEAREIEKSFQIASHKVDSLKERLTAFSRQEQQLLHALRGVSFDVHRGEFFGIVGRNGSGKSTLLKILASIYKADAGTVRMAGRLAPFIELGVGFNPELTAVENVELNGVMMGLHRREARQRLGAVLEFAELEDFVDMKLKNYSSGMLVRLAFSVMIQSDAEILLIDEVLAVGDAAFQQKCADVFHEIRDSDRTVILVTHDMAAVEHYCHRAILLHDGVVADSGDPDGVARSYLRLNFENASAGAGDAEDFGEAPELRMVEARLLGADGGEVKSVETGDDLRLEAVFEADRTIERPSFGFTFVNADGVSIGGVGKDLEDGGPMRLEAGQRVTIEATVENPMAPGRYYAQCFVYRNHNYGDIVLHAPHVLDFVVFGNALPGVVALESEVTTTVEEAS
ncbi:MAG TPA: ABC transporter ATP-binding protein [Solirubrobacterales bacterium]|nr:ABC transporter ATP-binding protein [Solirubrobacterales bacterium]